MAKKDLLILCNAVKIAKIATGEIKDDKSDHPEKIKAGRIGGNVRANKLTPEERSEIAKKAAKSRWEEKS